jgi:8-oxo-dGTP diphosphatase
MTEYVLGFLFNNDLSKVALIKKNRPEWQAGLLNGVGGHIEQNENPIDAMIREFEEETSIKIVNWIHYCMMNEDKNFVVYVYAAVGNLEELKTKTDEEIIIFNVKDINKKRNELLSNVPWLIEMAIDKLKHNEFIISNIRY